MNILDDLLKIENDKNIYQYSFSYKNILMYPVIRFYLLQRAIEETHGLSPAYDPFSVGKLQKIRYLLKSFLLKPPRYIQSDIVFFGSDSANIIVNDVYFNRLTDSFTSEFTSKTLVIETSHRLSYRRPRAFPKVFADDFLNIFAAKISKINPKYKKQKSNELLQIDSFLEYLREHFNHKFGNSNVWEKMRKDLLDFSMKIQLLHKMYLKLIKCLSPKTIMLLGACYGGSVIPIILVAKELDIPIGEYQHGLISLSHPAYNYSAELHDCYKNYMPDFYMSYGRYWTENSRLPIKVIEIGNPYLSETISQLNQSNQNKKKEQVLYISSAISPEQYVYEVLQLKTNLADKGYTIIFRIHPSETERLKTVYKPLVDADIQIDTQPLYEILKDTKYLTGDYSTVFFEAAIFDCVIFVRDTAYNRANLDISQFNAIQSMEEMISNIISKKYKKTDYKIFWADNWRFRYKTLINSFLY